MEASGNSDFVYEFGKFLVDPKERTLFADGVPIHLRAKEFDTLLLLLAHSGHALSKDAMISAIWHDSIVEEANLAKQISRLRKLINTTGEEYIETLPKHGYRFNAVVRRSIVEADDDVILEKRTFKRVTFAVDNEPQPAGLALPAAPGRAWLRRLGLALFAAIVGLALLAWYFRQDLFPAAAKIDPYEPIRLTDNPNDDTAPSWTKDGHIRFLRIYPDNSGETWIMKADGSEQSVMSWADGRKVFNWSPDEEKVLFVKRGDPKTVYLSNADGSEERILPFGSGQWSRDSKMLAFHRRGPGDSADIFVYVIATGELRNITNSTSFNADPSFSPDGTRLLFASNRDGNPEIYSIGLDGQGLLRLTDDPALDAHAGYSPDGTKIFFGSMRNNEDGDIYSMNPDGSGVVRVTGWDKSNETFGPASWSPDGTRIAFYSDRNGKDDIYVVSAETVRPRLLLSDSDHDLSAPSYSPDGKKIVYGVDLEDRSGELRVLDLETQATTLIRKTELSQRSANWSPDGSLITYSDRANGNSEVFVATTDGTEVKNLTNAPSLDLDPAWSPDGRRIVFASGTSPGSGVELYSMNADGSDRRPITPREGWEGDPVWSPDGLHIIFVCDRTDSPGDMMDLCEIGVDGSGEKRILFHPNHDVRPAVSPDGNRIAFIARSDGNLELYLVNRDGSGLSRLTRDAADDQRPAWSPDGKKIAFASNRGGRYAIYEVDVP